MNLAASADPDVLDAATARCARWGVGLVFFVNGAAFASWVSRIPALRAGMQLSDGALGSVLFALTAGVLLAFPLVGRLARVLGARQLALLSGALTLVMLPMPFMVGILPSLVLVMLELGMANGAMQVSMNVLAVDVQVRVARPVVSSLHGLWSAGGLAGAALGSLAAHAGLGPATQLAGMSMLLGALLVAAALLLRRVPAARTPAARAAPAPRGRFAGADRRLVGLGLVCFCSFLIEGAMADWGAVWLREKALASESVAALGYAVFAGAMTTMRLAGDRVVARFGPVRPPRLLTAAGTLALAAALALARIDATLLAFAALGLGLAVVVPSAFAAGARHADAHHGGGDGPRARAIALMSAFGYTGLLVGPPVIGWIAQASALQWALGLLVVLGAAIVALAPLLRAPAPARHADRAARCPPLADPGRG
jgi:hypothetical protein